MRVPDAELEILKVVWRLGDPCTAKQIRQVLKPARDHATVTTLLRRLEKRGCVRREKKIAGREFVYQAVVKPEKTKRALVKSFLQRAFDGSGIEMVNALFQTKPPTDKEIQDLEELIKQLKKQRQKKKGTK